MCYILRKACVVTLYHIMTHKDTVMCPLILPKQTVFSVLTVCLMIQRNLIVTHAPGHV